MKRVFGFLAVCTALVLSMMIAPEANAQQGPGPGPLTTVANNPLYAAYFGATERAMAAALDAAESDIGQLCPDGCSTPVLDPLYNQLNRLTSVANQILVGQGSPQLVADLGRALRGIAPEELSSLRAASNEFASDQRDQIRSRLEALRKGAQGFATNGVPLNQRLASHERSLIGGASADVPTDFSRWGGFLNGSYSRADRDPTALEDAFNITGTDVSLGVDYRLSYHSVLGAMVTHTSRKLEFDSSKSVTGGDVDSSGIAGVLFASYEWDGPYISGSLGYQRLSNDITRNSHVDFPAPTDIVSTGSTDSTATTVTLDGGWMLQNGAFGYEPILRVLYRDTKFDAFTESSVEAGGSSGVAFKVAERSTTTLNASLGMKMSYAFKPSFGVFLPYLQGEYRHEFKDEAMQSRADFADIVAAGVTSITSTLRLDSDRPDASYYVAEAGASAVFKHGIQGFLNARSLFGLADSKFYVISLGIRGEF